MAEFKVIDEAVFARNSERAQRSRTPRAIRARFDGRRKRLIVELDTGIEFSFEPAKTYGICRWPSCQEGTAVSEIRTAVYVTTAGPRTAAPAVAAEPTSR